MGRLKKAHFHIEFSEFSLLKVYLEADQALMMDVML